MVSRRTVLSTLGIIGAAAAGAARAQGRRDLIVRANGTATLAGTTYRCALGRSGIHRDKREGDGVTPEGVWPLRQVFYRPDRHAAPATILPTRALQGTDGWCDAPADARYNQSVVLPYPASAEKLWRDDHLYDVIVVVGYNDAPVRKGAGSAIFLHLARENYTPTEGCIAFKEPDLRAILAAVDATSMVDIRG